MRLLALLLLLPVSLSARAPTIEDAVKAYVALPWAHAKTGDGSVLVCVPAAHEERLDAIISYLAARARAVCS